MTTDSDQSNLFCRINVQSEMPHPEFVALVARGVGGARRMNAVTTDKLDISVDENDVFDAEKSSTGKDRWLYFRYTLEIDPIAGVAPGDYIAAVGALLRSLWSSGMDAVAASDFEDQLPCNIRRSEWGNTARLQDGDGSGKGSETLSEVEYT